MVEVRNSVACPGPAVILRDVSQHPDFLSVCLSVCLSVSSRSLPGSVGADSRVKALPAPH